MTEIVASIIDASANQQPNIGVTDWVAVQSMVEQIGYNSDLQTRAKDVAVMSAEDIAAQVTLLHSVLAPETDQNPYPMAMSLISPNEGTRRATMLPEERFSLFEHATSLVGELGKKYKEGEEQAYLNRSANIFALATVLSHPFEDGNGRTARMLAGLIRSGHKNGEPLPEDLVTLGTNRPEDGFRITAFLPHKQGRSMSPLELLDAVAGYDIPLNEPKTYEQKMFNYMRQPW